MALLYTGSYSFGMQKYYTKHCYGINMMMIQMFASPNFPNGEEIQNLMKKIAKSLDNNNNPHQIYDFVKYIRDQKDLLRTTKRGINWMEI